MHHSCEHAILHQRVSGGTLYPTSEARTRFLACSHQPGCPCIPRASIDRSNFSREQFRVCREARVSAALDCRNILGSMRQWTCQSPEFSLVTFRGGGALKNARICCTSFWRLPAFIESADPSPDIVRMWVVLCMFCVNCLRV